MILSLTALAVASGCAHAPERTVSRGQLRDSWGSISDANYLRTRGIGSAPPDAKGQTKRRALSRNAALASARYEMLAAITGVRVLGGITIGELMHKHSRINEVANAIVRGAEEVQVEWTASDDCVVTLQIPRKKVEELVREDPKLKPLTEDEYRAALLRGAEKEGQLHQAIYYPYYRDKSPMTALGLGMAFPGLGQLYAGDQDSTDGYYSMVMVITLAGAGGALLRPQEVGEARADGTREKARRPGYGYALIGLAALLHVRAAVDGMKRVHDRGGYFVVEPVRGGGRATWQKKF